MCRLKGNHETDFRITAIMDGLVLAAFLVVIIFGIVNIFLGQGCLLVRILESLLLFGVGAVLGCVYIWLLHPLKHIKREVYNIAETEEMESAGPGAYRGWRFDRQSDLDAYVQGT